MYNLTNLLQAFPDQEINAIKTRLSLKTRQDSYWLGSVHAVLADALASGDRVARAMSSLNAREKDVFRYVAAHGGAVTRREIEGCFPDSGAALSRLLHLCLVFEDPLCKRKDGIPDVLVMPLEIKRSVVLSMNEKTSLGNCLAARNYIWLKRVASVLRAGRQGSKVAAIVRIRETLYDPDTLRDVIAGVPPDPKKWFDRILGHDGVFDLREEKVPGIEFPSFMASYTGVRYDSPIQSLIERALVFPLPENHPRYLVVPPDLLAILKPPEARKSTVSFPSEAPPVLRAWGLRILSDLRLFAAYHGTGRLRYTQKDYPEKKGILSFVKALGVSEENYGYFLYQSLDPFLGPIAEGLPDPLGESPTEALRQLVRHWQENEEWRESNAIRDVHQDAYSAPDSALSARRSLLLRVLRDLPVNRWATFKSLSARLCEEGWMKVSWMEDGGGNGDDWGGYERTGSHASEIDAMGTLENMLAESALWLGLVEVGLTPGRRNEANLSHVRLTEWGHFFLTDGRGEFPALGQNPVEHTFKLLPNLEIVLPPRLQAAGQATLFRVAVLKSPHAFVLTKASLCEALDGGMTKEEILRFLEVSSQTGLPASVRQAVEEWAASHGRIKVGEAGIYVEADDPLLFVELQSHKAFRDILVKPLGDRVALVSGGDPERVLRLLRKLGYFSVHDKPVPPSNR